VRIVKPMAMPHSRKYAGRRRLFRYAKIARRKKKAHGTSVMACIEYLMKYCVDIETIIASRPSHASSVSSRTRK
jgi:hypothetical protein